MMSKSCVKANEKKSSSTTKKKKKSFFVCVCVRMWFYYLNTFFNAEWLRKRKQNKSRVIAISVFYSCFEGANKMCMEIL